MKILDRRLVAVVCFAIVGIFAVLPVCGQEGLSRWALGRPSLLIDMPGDPSGGGAAWAEKSIYSIFPSSWSAEGSGVRVEVARIYTAKSPTDLLAEIGQKVSVPMTPTGRGQLSGREFVNFLGSNRIAVVIGNDGGVMGGASWVVMATFKDAAGRALAGSIFEGIKVEREGARHWAIRSLGPTFLASELPFELTKIPATEAGRTRYESSFDGMDVRVTDETPSAGSSFDKETTLKNFIDGYRLRTGVTDFTSSREKYKLDTRDGEMVTMTFKRGNRSYRVYDIAFIEKQRAVVASIQIDPNRADHADTTSRILRSLKTALNPVYGWKTYDVGGKGLYMDLPVAPSAPKMMGSVQVYNSDTPLAMTEIRQLEVGYPSAHDPDFSAKQYFEMQQALSANQKFELQGIDKLLIDGLEARLVRATWKNGKETNKRQILTIYGYETQWIIDMLASKETDLYMERVMQSVRVRIPFSPTAIRQSFGSMGVSFIVGDKRLEPKITQNAADPDFAREESATAQIDKSILAVYEMVFKNAAPPITDERGKTFMDGFLRGLSQAAGVQLTATQLSSFPINIDGIAGRHIIYDISAGGKQDSVVIQADFIMLGQDKKFWTATVITNYDGGLTARYNRARILNSLRVGY